MLKRDKNNPADYFRQESMPRPAPRFAHIPTPLNQETPKPSVPDISILSNSSSQSPKVTLPNCCGRGPSQSPNMNNSNSCGQGSSQSPYNIHNNNCCGHGQFQSPCLNNSCGCGASQSPYTNNSCGHGGSQSHSPYLNNSGQSETPSSTSNRPLPRKLTSILKETPQRFPNTTSEFDSSLKDIGISQQSSPKDLALTFSPLPPPPPPPLAAETNNNNEALLQELITLIKNQGLIINKMQEQLDVLLESKENFDVGHCCNCNQQVSLALPPPPPPIPPNSVEGRRSSHRHNNNVLIQPPSPFTTPEKSTDSTIYGMSSKNLSFSTKQYLQRHGLVGSGNGMRNGGRERRSASPKLFQSNCSGSSGDDVSEHKIRDRNRILDITAIKNQPKLT